MALEDALLSGLFETPKVIYQQNPYIAAAQGFNSIPLQASESDDPWAVALAQIGKGLVGGLVSGYGVKSAQEEEAVYQDKLARALVANSKGEDVGAVLGDDPLTKALLPKFAMLNSVRTAEKEKAKQALSYDLLKQDKALGSDGVIIPAPGAANTARQLKAAETLGTKQGEQMANAIQGAQGLSLSPEEKLTQETKHRGENEGYLKEINMAETGFQSMLKSFGRKDRTADIDYIYGAIQSVEPGMAVKDGEQIMVRNAGGLPGILQDALSKVNGGQGLDDNTRRGVLELAASRRDARLGQLEARKAGYAEMADRLGLDFKNVFPAPLPADSESYLDNLQGSDVEKLAQAVEKIESGGEKDPAKAVSKKGAIGPMQIMPDTAKDLGIDPNDPVQNRAGGRKYLSQLLQKYDGNEKLALAAYNWGMGNLDELIQKKRTLNWSELSRSVPDETRDYVKSVRQQKSNVAPAIQTGNSELGAANIVTKQESVYKPIIGERKIDPATGIIWEMGPNGKPRRVS